MVERLATLPEFLVRTWFAWVLIGLFFGLLWLADRVAPDDIDDLVREEAHNGRA
jgi:hypothetical protein